MFKTTHMKKRERKSKDTLNKHIKNLTDRLVVVHDGGGWVVMVEL